MKNPDTPNYYVGIGASAGGLEAIEAFFTNMPPQNGLAFIVVQHLSPDYKSLMAEILSKHTEMTIHRAEDGMEVEPNHIYLIPPKKNLTIFHGRLLLHEQEHNKGINLPIDLFLRSLAEDQGDKSVAIILSGTGSDGTRGVRAIKENGGMVMVQDEETAKFDGMPRSAINTGLADYILSPDKMPDRLLSYAEHPYTNKSEISSSLYTHEDNLTRIFSLLREKFKIDFTYYKSSTVIRRIERRMSVNQFSDLKDYVHFMEAYPREVSSLYRELLIGVTSFFRDPEVFEALNIKYLPELLQQHAGEEVRFWVAGCSTGEEAYSLAILAQECMDRLEIKCDLKIFATDIDGNAIQQAGNGAYPESIAADLDQELITKYFYQKEDGLLYIVRPVREMVVFARHNVLKDPPFTNIHLISCRNLLIYLQPVLQNKVLELFNFSLPAGGYLLLGTSESVGDMAEFFEPQDHKLKIYKSKGKRNVNLLNQRVLPRFDTSRSVYAGVPGLGGRQRHNEERILERILQALGSDYFTCGLLINENTELMHIFGNPEGFLRYPTGPMAFSVSKIAEREFSIPLSTGIQKVFSKQTDLNYSNIRVRRDDNQSEEYRLRIKYLKPKKGQEPFALALLEKVDSQTPPLTGETTVHSYDLGKEAEQRIQDLEQELQFTKENLQATIEELETSNEELQATNEELLASNEELQSTNEELQSVNEELYTVNAEHQRKIIELTELNNDVSNILSSSHSAILFLDENYEIRKFTESATEIFRIMEQDIGRPISHISHNLENLDISRDLLEIEDRIRQSQQEGKELGREFQEKPVFKEVHTSDEKKYLMEYIPYFISPRKISGILLKFTDISRLREAEKEVRFQAQILEAIEHAIIVTDMNGIIIYWNDEAEKLYQWPRTEVMGRPIVDVTVPDYTREKGNEILTTLREGKSWKGVFEVRRRDGITFTATVANSPLTDSKGNILGVIGISDDYRWFAVPD